MKTINKVKKLILTVCFGIGTVLGTATAGDDVIAYWDFGGGDNENHTLSAALTADGITVSDFSGGGDFPAYHDNVDAGTRTSNFAVSGTGDITANLDVPAPSGEYTTTAVRQWTTNTRDQALAAGSPFFGFNVTVDSGWIMDIDGLSYAIAKNTTTSNQPGIAARYSVDDFDTFTDIGYIENSVSWLAAGQFGRVTFDLSMQEDLQGLTEGDTIEFRFFSYQQTGADDRVRFAEPTLFGTVIPEPSTLVLLGLGGMVLLKRRRM